MNLVIIIIIIILFRHRLNIIYIYMCINLAIHLYTCIMLKYRCVEPREICHLVDTRPITTH